jgi:hypothetical protein
MKDFKEQLFKTLSRNDTGETGGHQSGISIPKDVARSSIFPQMSTQFLNPRREIVFVDEGGRDWTLQYIYYNDKYHGKPAGKCHDEFRLTCTNAYLREHNIKSGDQIWFAITEDGERHIGFLRAGQSPENTYKEEDGFVILKIRSWTNIKKY